MTQRTLWAVIVMADYELSTKLFRWKANAHKYALDQVTEWGYVKEPGQGYESWDEWVQSDEPLNTGEMIDIQVVENPLWLVV